MGGPGTLRHGDPVQPGLSWGDHFDFAQASFFLNLFQA